MPLASLQPIVADPDRFAEAVDTAPASWGLGFRTAWKSGQLPDPFGWIVADDQRAFDRDLERMTGYSEKLSPKEATDAYGIDGHLTFSEPLLASQAAWKMRATRERIFQEEVLANTEIGPLGIMAASMGGSLFDPVALPLFLAPELLGVARGAKWVVDGLRGARTVANAGRMATAGRWALEGAIEGVAGGAMYEAVNYGLRNEAGEDYTGGDAMRNLLLGGILGAGFKGALGAMIGGGGGRDPLQRSRGAEEALEDALDGPEPRLPPDVEALPEDMRSAALVAAIDQMTDDAPVTVGKLVEKQREVAVAALDETRLPPQGSLKARFLEADVAISAKGREIPIRYALVELDDLIASHDTDLIENPDYPGELQPRDRDRAGSMANNRNLQKVMHPRLLMRGPSAEGGSPMTSADGVVESGNGRIIALRRDRAEGGELWGRYLDELAAQGFDTTGMKAPVLVRVRDNLLTGPERAALARELNGKIGEQLGAREQGMVDAAAMDAGVLDLLQGGDVASAANRPFVRAMLQKVAGNDLNALVDAAGALSKAGAERIKAALVAHAYNDARLLDAVYEAADGEIKAIGKALEEAAPAWSRMRAAIARGQTAAEVDLTPHLRAAVDLVRYARDSKTPLAELFAMRQGTPDMITGEVLSPQTEAVLRILFWDDPKSGDIQFKKPRGAARIAKALQHYAAAAEATPPGADLLGDAPDAKAARFLAEARRLAASLEAASDDERDLLAVLRAADDEPAPQRPDGAAGGDVPPTGGDGDGPGGSGARPDGGGSPGAQGGGVSPDQPAVEGPRPVELDETLRDTMRADSAAARQAGDGRLIEADIEGVYVGALSAVDKAGEAGIAKLAAHFQASRDALRAKFGPTVRLFRAEAPKGEHNAGTITLRMADRETAQMFADDTGRALIAYDVPVDDIVAAFHGGLSRQGKPLKYHEFIVRKAAAVAAEELVKAGAPPSQPTSTLILGYRRLKDAAKALAAEQGKISDAEYRSRVATAAEGLAQAREVKADPELRDAVKSVVTNSKYVTKAERDLAAGKIDAAYLAATVEHWQALTTRLTSMLDERQPVRPKATDAAPAPATAATASATPAEPQIVELRRKGDRFPLARVQAHQTPDGQWEGRWDFSSGVAGGGGTSSGKFATAEEALNAARDIIRLHTRTDTDAKTRAIRKWLGDEVVAPAKAAKKQRSLPQMHKELLDMMRAGDREGLTTALAVAQTDFGDLPHPFVQPKETADYAQAMIEFMDRLADPRFRAEGEVDIAKVLHDEAWSKFQKAQKKFLAGDMDAKDFLPIRQAEEDALARLDAAEAALRALPEPEPPPAPQEPDLFGGMEEPAAKPLPTRGQAAIAADPELAALQADTEGLIEAEGLQLETPRNADPDTLAEAVRAAAFCINEGGLG